MLSVFSQPEAAQGSPCQEAAAVVLTTRPVSNASEASADCLSRALKVSIVTVKCGLYMRFVVVVYIIQIRKRFITEN
jgi:hypothetical protein